MHFSDLRALDRDTRISDDNHYVVVEFKMWRAEVYQINEQLVPQEPGSVTMVTVEADRYAFQQSVSPNRCATTDRRARGYDLGRVHLTTRDVEVAKKVKKELYRRHWQKLLEYSADEKWALLPQNESLDLFEQFYAHLLSQPHNSGFSGGMSPKSVISRAPMDHLARLPDKERFETKAKRLCRIKADAIMLPMEVLAVEFQMFVSAGYWWRLKTDQTHRDHQKLTVYYLSEAYIDYRELQSELFKEFKCRLWFVALNPASFHPSPQHTRRGPDWSAGRPMYSWNHPQFSQQATMMAQSYFASTNDRRFEQPLMSTRRNTIATPSPWNQQGYPNQLHGF